MLLTLRWYLLLFMYVVASAQMIIPCTRDSQCPHSQFCYQPSALNLGTCVPCWMCCAFPQGPISSCSESRCTCNSVCYSDWDCGLGRYCYEPQNVCNPCWRDADRSCLNNATVTPVFSFYQYWMYQIVKGNSTVAISDVTQWLGTNASFIIPTLFKNTTTLPFNSFVTALVDVVNVSFKSNPTCNNNTSIGGLSEGCPCSVNDACRAGLRCEIDTRGGALVGFFVNPLRAMFNSVCVPCQSGSWCPKGTMKLNPSCPEGSFCPTPSERHDCGSGKFCPVGSTSPLTCNVTDLLQTTLSYRVRDAIVIDQLINKQNPYKGNICPSNSSVPFDVCKGGQYCPNTSVALPCPKGYYCRPQSVDPLMCPGLSLCPEGSAIPKFIGIPYLFAGVLTVAVICFICIIKYKRRDAVVVTKEHVPLTFVTPPIPVQPHVYPGVSFVHEELVIEEIAMYDVSARVSPQKDPWLWPNSAVFNPGKLNAIIGGSGCGKSTFLDLLRGTVPGGVLTGSVQIKLKDEQPWTLNLSDMDPGVYEKCKSIRGYVPQDDIVYGDLTVQENLLYSSLIKKRCACRKEARDIVDRTIQKLGLGYVKDRIVGTVESRGISGGQRKRVNIGMEIVHQPLLLIMDEPTSGLDATGCQKLIDLCRDLCDTSSMTIIAVIHQPRYTSFILFDHIVLLCKYGTVFEGSPVSSLVYFSQGLDIAFDKNENPADVLMDIISGSRGFQQENLVTIWRESGMEWLKRCHEVYPLLPWIVQESIVFDDMTNKYMHLILDNQILSPTFTTNLFKDHGIPVNERVINEFLVVNNIRSWNDFIRYMHKVCSAAYCRNDYGNIIERLSLFQQAPKGIYQQFTELQRIRHISLAYKFIRILLKRTGKDHLVVHNRIRIGLEQEMMLLSMSCKAITKKQVTVGKESLIVLQPPPLWFTQTLTILQRKAISLWRSPWPIQLIVPLAASFIVGNIQGADTDIVTYPNNVAYAMVTLGVLSIITHIRTFSLDKVVIKRETDSKVSILPYFLAYGMVDLIWIVLLPIIFVIPYYYFTLPHTSLFSYLSVAVCICWWCSGAAYVLSALPLGLQWTNLFGVFVGIIFGAFLQGLNPTIAQSKGKLQEVFLHGSYNRWAMEILSLKEFAAFDQTQPNVIWPTMDKIGLCGFDGSLRSEPFFLLKLLRNSDVLSFCGPYICNAYLWLFGYGAAFRIIAVLSLWCFNYPITLRAVMQLKDMLHL